MTETKKPLPFITDPKGHTWKLNEQGKVDEYAIDDDRHNGPLCVVCGHSFCYLCTDGEVDEPCTGPIPLAEDIERLDGMIKNFTNRRDALKRRMANGETHRNYFDK